MDCLCTPLSRLDEKFKLTFKRQFLCKILSVVSDQHTISQDPPYLSPYNRLQIFLHISHQPHEVVPIQEQQAIKQETQDPGTMKQQLSLLDCFLHMCNFDRRNYKLLTYLRFSTPSSWHSFTRKQNFKTYVKFKDLVWQQLYCYFSTGFFTVIIYLFSLSLG